MNFRKKIISFLIILFSIGSSISAGIFFQNKSIIVNPNMYNNISLPVILQMLSWILVSFSIVSMALFLLKITSEKNDKMNDWGIISLIKYFSNNFIYKSCKNFFLFIYLPIIYFIIPYYALLAFQDAFGFDLPWWGLMIISFFISMWFLFISGISPKLANIQNWVMSSFACLGILFAICVSFISPHFGFKTPTNITVLHIPNKPINIIVQPFNTIFYGISTIMLIPAIFFAFGGFYPAIITQKQNNQYKKEHSFIWVGILIAVFYALIMIATIFDAASNSSNNFIPLQNILSDSIVHFFFNHHIIWILIIINFFIGFGVLAVINSIAIYTPRLYEHLICNDEIPFTQKWKIKLSNKESKKPWVGIWILFIIIIPIFIIFSLVGTFAYFNANGYTGHFNLIKVSEMQGNIWSNIVNNPALHYKMNTQSTNLYSMIDLLAQWTSTFVFLYIIILLWYKTIKNKNLKKWKKSGCIIFISIPSLIIMISVILVFSSTFGDLIMFSLSYNSYIEQANIFDKSYSSNFNPYIIFVHNHNNISIYDAINNYVHNVISYDKIILISQITKTLTLLLFVKLSFIPIIWDYKPKKQNKLNKLGLNCLNDNKIRLSEYFR